MKRTAILLLCILMLAAPQFSLGQANPTSADSSTLHAFSTPEETWNHFKTAIHGGDFDTARKCCCPGKTVCVIKFEKMDEQKRKNLVQSMLPIKKIDQRGNRAKYEVVRDVNGTPFSTFVYFEKVENDWKIENY